ncbi:MAG: 50S ribosomal protein L15 [Candidatus Magasanikbacteria bacterium]|nr:50S ribosomal protein L15 [Candidatus Magasanikbacteria bacterium]
MITMHSLKSNKGARKKKFKVGRGHGTGLGTTAGRGTKGQRARTGGRKGLHLLGMRGNILQTPKLRGVKSQKERPEVVDLDTLARLFNDGETVSPETLKKKGLGARVKVLGNGTMTKKLAVKGVAASAGAKEKIISAGGSITE